MELIRLQVVPLIKTLDDVKIIVDAAYQGSYTLKHLNEQ